MFNAPSPPSTLAATRPTLAFGFVATNAMATACVPEHRDRGRQGGALVPEVTSDVIGLTAHSDNADVVRQSAANRHRHSDQLCRKLCGRDAQEYPLAGHRRHSTPAFWVTTRPR
jgi:hypothetical protein